MKNLTLIVTLSLVLITNLFAADKLFSILKGKIVTNHTNDIQVVITESDGSILDMTSISKNGEYKLDLTIMDTPSLVEVKKLFVEVKNAKGKKRKYPIRQRINVSGDTILLKPLIFN